jgi:hypothetical protein
MRLAKKELIYHLTRQPQSTLTSLYLAGQGIEFLGDGLSGKLSSVGVAVGLLEEGGVAVPWDGTLVDEPRLFNEPRLNPALFDGTLLVDGTLVRCEWVCSSSLSRRGIRIY